MNHFTLERASLHSILEKNVLISQTFYFSILFQRSFVQRHSIIRALYSIHSLFLQLSHIRRIFYTFHPTLSLHIYIARAECFLIPDDAVDRRKLGFQILLFKQQFKPSLEQFYIFLIMLLKDNMNRLLKMRFLVLSRYPHSDPLLNQYVSTFNCVITRC